MTTKTTRSLRQPKEVVLSEVVEYLNTTLRVDEVKDFPNAVNGLQVESQRAVRKVAVAVDACEAVIQQAVEDEADLLIVHHGLFWSGLAPVTGAFYRKLRLALDNGLAIYSVHLPLDVHPRLGNNALLAAALGIRKTKPFLDFGVQALGNWDVASLIDKVEQAVHVPVHFAPGASEHVRRLGIVTGAGGNEVARAAEAGVDTFLTGEGAHWTFPLAEELGINLIYAGHYATETFGVQALGGELLRKFGTPWAFIDHPSGL